MTPDQYQTAAAALAQLDTEIADCRAKEQDCILKAREQNNLRRAFESTRITLEQQAAVVRQECEVFLAALRKQEAAAKEKAEAEAEAERAKSEQSELEQLRARVAELEAAKG